MWNNIVIGTAITLMRYINFRPLKFDYLFNMASGHFHIIPGYPAKAEKHCVVLYCWYGFEVTYLFCLHTDMEERHVIVYQNIAGSHWLCTLFTI